MQNHRRAWLGALQLFEQTSGAESRVRRGIAIAERKTYQHDVKILPAKNLQTLHGAVDDDRGREENSTHDIAGLLGNAQDSGRQTAGFRSSNSDTSGIENERIPPTLFHRHNQECLYRKM